MDKIHEKLNFKSKMLSCRHSEDEVQEEKEKEKEKKVVKEG